MAVKGPVEFGVNDIINSTLNVGLQNKCTLHTINELNLRVSDYINF